MSSATKVALVGRANVGKSTLFNCFSESKTAMVYDMPGVTRDCRTEFVEYLGYKFELTDTPGVDLYDDISLKTQVLKRIQETIQDADYVWFLVDGTVGMTNTDHEIAKMLRKTGKTIIVLANKNDRKDFDDFSFYELGFHSVVPISGGHQYGLYEIFTCMDETRMDETPSDVERSSIAILGRPNAGKSTLVNTILGKDYQLTGSTPGLTRESVGYNFEFDDHAYRLIDTAGLRRKTKVTEHLERMSVKASFESLDFAECVIFLIDTQGLSEFRFDQQDLTLIKRTLDEGRCLIIGLSKWDSVKEPKKLLASVHYNLDLKGMSYIPVVPISSFKKIGLTKLFEQVKNALYFWNKRLSTSKLNLWLRDAVDARQSPMVKGRLVKMKFATQVKTRPPRICIFTNTDDDGLEQYRRYLVNTFRQEFGYDGVPIRILFRRSDNPYATKDKDTENEEQRRAPKRDPKIEKGA